MGSHTSAELRPILDDLRRIVQALRTTGVEARRKVALSGAQLFVLQQLADESPLSVNELAARIHTHQSSVSTMVARLAARGLVSRSSSPDDRRRTEVSLTARARRLLDRAPATAQERLVQALEALPESGRRALAAGLSQLAGAVGGQATGVPPLFFEQPARARSRRARS